MWAVSLMPSESRDTSSKVALYSLVSSILNFSIVNTSTLEPPNQKIK